MNAVQALHAPPDRDLICLNTERPKNHREDRRGYVIVRIHSDSIYQSGEYAILLRSELKGRGLGSALMQMIIEYARSEGLKTISGDVLIDNTVMLAHVPQPRLRGQDGSRRARYLRRQADALIARSDCLPGASVPVQSEPARR